jgi:hypothetical protein
VDTAILIPSSRLQISDLERFRNAPFENMIKFSVDIRLRKIALGDEMHADSEEELLRFRERLGELSLHVAQDDPGFMMMYRTLMNWTGGTSRVEL